MIKKISNPLYSNPIECTNKINEIIDIVNLLLEHHPKLLDKSGSTDYIDGKLFKD